MDVTSAVANLSGLLWALHRGDMRRELYEQYKREHPEEMGQIGYRYAYNAQVEEVRKAARAEKVAKVNEWKRRLGYE